MRLWIAVLLFFSLTLPAGAAESLDVTTFVVLGDGLTAGMRNARLYEEAQETSFPALAARQMGTIFPLPRIKGPGIGSVPGLPQGIVDLPKTLQNTVREFPPNLFVFNLSIPGYGPADSLTLRPGWPLINKLDATQTAANFILGFPALILNREVPLWTQVQYAQRIRPTLLLVCLGFDPLVDQAVRRSRLESPEPIDSGGNYRQMLDSLSRQHASILVATVPNPLWTPYFSTLDQATLLTGVPSDVLEVLYQLEGDDRLTLPGLFTVANQLLRQEIEPLPSGSVLKAADAAVIEAMVESWNQNVRAAAADTGASLFDLAAYLQEVQSEGLVVAERELSADYLGGFYSLDGVYPGPVGHGAIANRFLDFLNQSFGSDFRSLDLDPLVEEEIALAATIRQRRRFSIEELERFIPNLRQRLEEHRLERSRKPPDESERRPLLPERSSIRRGGGR